MPNITRRSALRLLTAALPGLAAARGMSQQGVQVRPGRYTGNATSLGNYTIPDWFGDAKFGIWAHWGPQSAVGDGDWYARNMYMEGTPQYKYHRERFGPQSKVGYKDLVPLFTADRWDPEHLMDLYQRAGAKYFFSMGVHHDNFDLWNSKYQPRWNAVAAGPHKDVVGLWAAAARRRGLRFGVSEHLSNSFDWFAPAHMADTQGEFAGVPYDGQNPAYADLYHDYSAQPAGFAASILKDPMGRNAPEAWKLQYFRRVKDLVDQHAPDLLYTDGGIPFGDLGYSTVAELYNTSGVTAMGQSAAVYFSKTAAQCLHGTCTLDRERGVLDDIQPHPWQTDTCIGDWHYNAGQTYKSAKKVIDLLVDIVSKNGNLLLNIPLPASGEPDAEELRVLAGVTEWMQQNGEAIFHTRPWKVYGEGPSTKVVIRASGEEFDPNEGKKPDLGASDVRYTSRGNRIYALVQGWPQEQVVLGAMGTGGAGVPKVTDVRLLGTGQPLAFKQEGAGLRVQFGAVKRPSAAEIGIALRVMVE